MPSTSPDMLENDQSTSPSLTFETTFPTHSRARAIQRNTNAPIEADRMDDDEEEDEEAIEERDEALRKEIVRVAKEDPSFPIWKRRIIHGVWITLAIFLAWLSNIVINIIHFSPKINL